MSPIPCLQVLLDRLAQDKEKEMMEKENQQLKALLKQYLDGERKNTIILLGFCSHILKSVTYWGRFTILLDNEKSL